MIILLSIFLIFVILTVSIRSCSNKQKKINEEQSQNFWNKEHDANFVRKKDISNLPYIKIPLDELPLSEASDPKLNDFTNRIISLSKVNILDLSNQSNTDLKLMYGAPNLPMLIDCDTRYTELIKLLNQWAKSLYDLNNLEAAKKVLEFALSCNTPIAQSYLLLADIYNENGETNKLKELLDIKCKTLNSPNKSTVIAYISKLLNFG